MDFALNVERNLIERFVNLIRQFLGIAARHEKPLATPSHACILVCALPGSNEYTP